VYTFLVDRIGIRELRQDLSRHVRKAGSGQSVIVTIDGEPRARLVPFIEDTVELTMDELIATGQVIPARRRGEKPPPPPPMVKANRPSKEILDELREDRI